MRLDEKFRKACSPDCPIILGRRLQPLTVERTGFLDELGVNLELMAAEDLLTAIHVCSIPHWRGRRYVRSGGRLLWQLLALLLFRLRAAEFHKAASEFRRYIERAREIPDFYHDSKQTRECTCPSLLMIERDLMSHYGFSAREIARMPIGAAQWRRLGILEGSGAIDFKTDEDVDGLEEIRRRAQEDHKEEQAATAAMEVTCGNG